MFNHIDCLNNIVVMQPEAPAYNWQLGGLTLLYP